jgi:D-glycero-D-manno-heptose 1,7-bisphosphate phosphatase
MEFLPGVCEGIRLLQDAGYLRIVVSNQRCVAKGLISTAELEALHARMRCNFEVAGAHIDAIYYCPHDYQPRCSCRKPQPGMLLEAARDHDIDLAASWMIGDSEQDVEAGQAAGCKTVRLLTPGEPTSAVLVAGSLLDAARQILRYVIKSPAMTGDICSHS